MSCSEFYARRSLLVHFERDPFHFDSAGAPPDILNRLPDPLLHGYACCERRNGGNVRLDRRRRILEHERENRRTGSGETDSEQSGMRRGSHRAENVGEPRNLQRFSL